MSSQVYLDGETGRLEEETEGERVDGTRGIRPKRRGGEEFEAGASKAYKYRRVIQALNASTLSQKYQSKFQRHEVTDQCIQKCIDHPKQWNIYLSSIIPIAGHKRNFLSEFMKTKEIDEKEIAEHEDGLKQEGQSSSCFSDTFKPSRVQQPDVFINPNIMKVKMEVDYVPVKIEPPEPELEPEPQPQPMTEPIANDDDGESESKTDVENFQDSAPKLKNIQIILTRIDTECPGPKPETSNVSANGNVNNNDFLSKSASLPKSPAPQDSDSDVDFDFDSNPKSKYDFDPDFNPPQAPPDLAWKLKLKSKSDFEIPQDLDLDSPRDWESDSDSDAEPDLDLDWDWDFKFDFGPCSDSGSGTGSSYTWVAWWDIVEKLKGKKEKINICFRIIAYLALLHTYKFPVKKEIGFSGWKICSSARLEKGLRLLEGKYKLITINAEDNIIHLNIERDGSGEMDKRKIEGGKWLRTLIHRTGTILPLLPEMIDSCIHILDPYKTSSSDTEQMFENLLLLAQSSGRGDGVTCLMNMNPLFWFFLFQLALRLLDAGRWEDALPVFSRVAQFCEEECAKNVKDKDKNSAALVSRSNIALILADQGLLDEALTIYQQILPKLESKFGPDDEGTVSAKYGMAEIFKSKGKWEKALKFYQHVYQSRKKTLGINHVRTKQVLEIIYEIRSLLSKEYKSK